MHKEDLALNNLQWLICHKTYPKKSNSAVIKSNDYFRMDIKYRFRYKLNEGFTVYNGEEM